MWPNATDPDIFSILTLKVEPLTAPGTYTIYLGNDEDQLWELYPTDEPFETTLESGQAIYAKCASGETSTLLIWEE